MSASIMDSASFDHVEVWLDDPALGGGSRVGSLHRHPSRRGDTIEFQYAQGWLENQAPIRAFALDHQLRLHPGPQRARSGASDLTAAFNDCSPDRWGRTLMDRREVIAAREEGRRTRTLRPWDYLLGVNDESRMGALRLRVPDGSYLDAHGLSTPPLTDLRELESIAQLIERGDDARNDRDVKWIKQLVVPGASLGGARPKASVRDTDGSLWMAKFPSTNDAYDVGMLEYVTYRLSLDAGIVMPEAKSMTLSNLGTTYRVRRFDRSASGDRRAYASAFTLLDVDDSENSSYLDLVGAIENEGVPAAIEADLHQLFRRVAFNVLIGNRDDHLRNHGFLRETAGWRLSPAFDVNPNADKDAHVLSISGDDPTPDTRLLMDQHPYYRLKKPAAEGILEGVRTVVRTWRTIARQCGARGADIALMDAVVDPER